MQHEDFVYFGDTGRLPYGSRSREILTRYARQDVNFLISKGVDAILAACGTISSVVLDNIKNEYNIPITGVVDASVEEALGATKNEIVGVIGTGATISSGAFEKKLLDADPNVRVISAACPLFVPLVENGYIDQNCTVTKLVAANYLEKNTEERRGHADPRLYAFSHHFRHFGRLSSRRDAGQFGKRGGAGARPADFSAARGRHFAVLRQ